MQIIGIVITAANERIQLGVVEDGRHCVRLLTPSTGVVTQERFYGELPPALDEFVKRIKAERESIASYEPIEEYALILNPSPNLNMPDYDIYTGFGEDPAESMALAEREMEKTGRFDVEELRAKPEYTAAIASLISGAETDNHTGIALVIR